MFYIVQLRRWFTSTTDILKISEKILYSEVLQKLGSLLHVFWFVTRYSGDNSGHENFFQKTEEQASRQEKEIELQKRKPENEERKRAQEKLKREEDFDFGKREMELEIWKKKEELELREKESEREHKAMMRKNDLEIRDKKLKMTYDILKECMKQPTRKATNTGWFRSTPEVRDELPNPLCKGVLNIYEKLMLDESKENLKLANEKQSKQGDKDELWLIEWRQLI